MNTLQDIQAAVGVAVDGIWGRKTRAAVAGALGCKADDRAIQAAVGVAVDGIIGPKTIAALARALGVPAGGNVDVFLDIGHTSDRAREWPSSFSSSLWSSEAGRSIMEALGFKPDARDSVEHMLNTAVAAAVVRHLPGVRVTAFDKPAMENDAEISAVISAANAVRPRVFVSIHHNAQGGAAWKTMGGTASGHVCYWVEGRKAGRALAREISESLDDFRRQCGGPDNRAENVQAGSYAVIRKLDTSISACLVEVGFYDNAQDATFIADHLDGIGRSIAEGIKASL